MSKFSSVFMPVLESMLNYRQALGFSRLSHEANLISFDRYCAKHNVTTPTLTESLVWGWINKQSEQKRTGMSNKAMTIRILGKYLCAIGQPSYILPDGMFVSKKTQAPYLFTDAELKALFFMADNLPMSADVSSTIAPVLFRLIYTCGLRPNEGRELERRHINFDTGKVLITKTKRHKERVVVMSDDMLALCRQYDKRTNPSGFFFPANGDSPLTNRQMSNMFHDCWCLSHPKTTPLPGVRVYDLRHRFASAVLNRWLDEDKNLYAMLPYLSAYMGHDTLSETAYYIHILPENLVKSAGIDWSAFDGMMPEVNV